MIRWMSIDPATTSGVALWLGDKLLDSLVVKPRGSKGAWYFDAMVCKDRRTA